MHHTAKWPIPLTDTLEYARICAAIYPGPTNQRYLSLDGTKFDHQRYVYGSKNRGFCRIIWNDEQLVVAFRGSQKILYDWLACNLRCTPTLLAKCSNTDPIVVHSGFQKAILAPNVRLTPAIPAFDAIVAKINELGLQDHPISFTGHSLGGALAVLSAIMFDNDFQTRNPVRSVVTFAAPAVGGPGFRRHYGDLHSKTVQFVNLRDVVPFLPPLWFNHVGSSVVLFEDHSETEWRWPRRIAKLFGQSDVHRIFRNHGMGEYLRVLKGYRQAIPPGDRPSPSAP